MNVRREKSKVCAAADTSLTCVTLFVATLTRLLALSPLHTALTPLGCSTDRHVIVWACHRISLLQPPTTLYSRPPNHTIVDSPRSLRPTMRHGLAGQ
ncbi:hypothetical protein BD309DRAFT_969435 [Dichomitus squalens]|nr:hypothetical protein BD309DRAFT_969435 [Dichomitus squalens]